MAEDETYLPAPSKSLLKGLKGLKIFALRNVSAQFSILIF